MITCPFCSHELTLMPRLNRPGDIVVCEVCAEVLVLEKDGTARNPTLKEMMEWPQEAHHLVDKLQHDIMRNR